VVRGHRLQLKAFIFQQLPTMGQILDAARFAKITGIAGAGTSGGKWWELMDEVWTSRAATAGHTCQPPDDKCRPVAFANTRAVTFVRSSDRREPCPNETAILTRCDQGRSFRCGQGRLPYHQTAVLSTDRRSRKRRPLTQLHAVAVAVNTAATVRQHKRVCYNCGCRGHSRVACRSARRPPQSSH